MPLFKEHSICLIDYTAEIRTWDVLVLPVTRLFASATKFVPVASGVEACQFL